MRVSLLVEYKTNKTKYSVIFVNMNNIEPHNRIKNVPRVITLRQNITILPIATNNDSIDTTTGTTRNISEN